jgi:hypothetical protein
MAAAFLGVERLLLAPENEVRDEPFLGLPFGLGENRLEDGRCHLVVDVGDAVTERLQDGAHVGQLPFVRPVVDAVEGGGRDELDVLRHRLVRGEHELLDQPVRLVPDRLDDGDDVARLAQQDVGVGKVEVERAARGPPRRQELGGTRRHAEH